MNYQNCRATLLAGAALSVSACGGGGGGGHVGSVPPPIVTPASSVVNIFANPVPATYASLGVTSTLSTADADQPHIRYTSGGFYEIQMPGAAYDRLIFDKGSIPADPSTFNIFQPASVAQNQAVFVTSNARLDGYLYSELASWFTQTANGFVAFGSPTAAGAVPATGSASFAGIVQGSSDILGPDPYWGDGMVPIPVNGTVALSFNFGAGTLAGSMTLSTAPYDDPVNLGTFNFKDTVYSTGSANYSGAFDSNGVGSNFFLGRFTGPNAEETIGAWALPFIYSVDGQNHQAEGAWIAKRP